MQRIAHSPGHPLVSGHRSHLPIRRHAPLRYPLHRLIYPLRRTIGHQVVALRNHPLNLIGRNTPIQNNRIPVFLILMPPRHHRFVDIAPQVTPLRRHLHVEIDEAIPLIRPQKCLPAPLHAHQLPIVVMKRRILICIRQTKPKFQRLFSRPHSPLRPHAPHLIPLLLPGKTASN